MEKLSINRFLDAQESNYEQALNELRNGRKVSHWMWYVFPQLRFLGHSDIAYYYGIVDEQEAKDYCSNGILYNRYIECCKVLENIQETEPENILGSIDALKLRSSLTLFYMVDENNQALYKKLIDKFYNGKWDSLTMDYMVSRRTVDMRLNDQPFQQIKNGEKTVEIRLYDEKRRKIQPGNIICFKHTGNKEQIQTRVVKLHTCVSFAKLFELVGLEMCGFNGYTIEQAVDRMKDFYSIEEEQKYGVVGIEIQLI